MKRVLAAAILGSISMGVHAEGHYVPGIEGVKAASVPPAGNYYIGYFVNYDIDGFKAPGTKQDIAGSKGKVTALAHRFVHMSKTKVLGADYGAELIVPMVNKDLTVGTYDKSKSGIGDVYVGPVVLGWHGDRWDAAAAAGVWLDTASSSPTDPALPGNGYKGTMLTGGGTVYLNADKSVSASALARYEINGKRSDGVEPGDQISLEWGVGKALANGWEVGVVGYDQWQATSDKGTTSSEKFHRHAAGLEVSHPVKSLGGLLKAAYYDEYDVKAGSVGPQPDGQTFRVNFVKPF